MLSLRRTKSFVFAWLASHLIRLAEQKKFLFSRDSTWRQVAKVYNIKCVFNMASDRGQNRQSDFMTSGSFVVVVFLSWWRDLSLFVSSSFLVSSYCFLRASPFALFHRFVFFVASFVSSRRRVLRFIDDGINKSAVTQFFPVST